MAPRSSPRRRVPKQHIAHLSVVALLAGSTAACISNTVPVASGPGPSALASVVASVDPGLLVSIDGQTRLPVIVTVVDHSGTVLRADPASGESPDRGVSFNVSPSDGRLLHLSWQ